MNATRLLSVAAVAAFASFAAQAGSAYGDLYGADFDAAPVSSTRTAAEVRAEGATVIAAQKNFFTATESAPSQLSRTEVRTQAVMAARAGEIAIGNRG